MLGSIYLKQSDWPKAGKVFMHITQMHPDRIRAWTTLGYIFDMLNNYEESIKCCKKALSLKSDTEQAQSILTFSLLKSGQHELAKIELEKLIAINPDSANAKYLLAAYTEGEQPEQSPESYIKSVFDGYAGNFENHLVNKLGYKVPELLDASIRTLLAENTSDLKIIDLGCGTGLLGEKLNDISGHLIGVDLSEEMLAIAKGKKVDGNQVYDELICKDVLESISEYDDVFGLVVATDVFIYIGELTSVFENIWKSMKKGALFGFSIELTDHEAGYRLLNTGRYAQSLSYINELTKKNNFQLCVSEKIIVRTEHSQSIDGYIFILKK